MIRLFTGFDPREAVGWHVFAESVLANAKDPVQLVPIGHRLAQGMSTGTNAFTRSRFLVPHLCGYKGWAIFADGADMMLRADIGELWQQVMAKKSEASLFCVKHSYRTKHARKYIGTNLEADNRDYERKNWASFFMIDCSSKLAQTLTPELVRDAPLLDLLQFRFAAESSIGALPMEWNWLVGEYEHNANAKLAHFTLGIPGFSHYARDEFADEWWAHLRSAQAGVQLT